MTSSEALSLGSADGKHFKLAGRLGLGGTLTMYIWFPYYKKTHQQLHRNPRPQIKKMTKYILNH